MIGTKEVKLNSNILPGEIIGIREFVIPSSKVQDQSRVATTASVPLLVLNTIGVSSSEFMGLYAAWRVNKPSLISISS